MSKNVVLTGMMGVGKSTIGKNLAKKLSFRFVDIDQLIEKQEGVSLSKIFKSKSESYFRSVENKITLQELVKKNMVISLGGGAFLDKNIRNTVKNNSVSFWLDLKVNILINRLSKSKKRPLLFNKNLSETVNKIYLERRKIYNEANFRIRCNDLKPDAIINKILKIYNNARNKI